MRSVLPSRQTIQVHLYDEGKAVVQGCATRRHHRAKMEFALIGTVMSQEEEAHGKDPALETLMRACVSHQGIRKGRQRLHELA